MIKFTEWVGNQSETAAVNLKLLDELKVILAKLKSSGFDKQKILAQVGLEYSK